ncbi:MAG: SUMF1/EgtB/PvdO family nonheme iron enzyme, partial [Planctomycetes bacterium]|nr:SUMF1/EgtB/PvdO family nonheme iron enzyme [Planctomycetota bacterium]
IADRRLHPEYAGLVIKPQVGLVPLGPDPRSGLWEFAHLLTGDPPPRGDDDRLRFDERSALVFVLLPGGSFAMGARRPEADEDPGAANIDPMAIDHEGPVHKVTLDPFFISKYEMSTAQWERGAHELLRDPDAAPVDHAEAGLLPVGRLNWETADRYLRRLGLDLPTEAQWEYAARGGTTTPWWTGSDRESLTGAVNILDLAATQSGNHDPAASEWPNFLDGFPGMAPVHSLLPNPFGLHHVAGNVWEHCRDAFQGYDVPALPGDGLRSLLPTDAYVVRGGSALQPASRCRSAMRASMDSTSSKSTSGVRPIRKLEN